MASPVLERGQHVVGVVFDDVVLDRAVPGASLGTGFDIDIRHRFPPCGVMTRKQPPRGVSVPGTGLDDNKVPKAKRPQQGHAEAVSVLIMPWGNGTPG